MAKIKYKPKMEKALKELDKLCKQIEGVIKDLNAPQKEIAIISIQNEIDNMQI